MSLLWQYFLWSCWATWLGFFPKLPRLASSWMSWELCPDFKAATARACSMEGPSALQAHARHMHVYSCDNKKAGVCWQGADMPLAYCSSKQVPRGDICSPSVVAVVLGPSYFFLFHLAMLPFHKASQIPSPFPRLKPFLRASKHAFLDCMG